MRPREPGEYTVSVEGVWQASDGKPLSYLGPQRQEFTISALTPIGLSAKTVSLIHVASALTAMVGGVLTFPFFRWLFKRLFDGRKKPEPNDSDY
jgi:hypothetical protein